MPRQQQYYQDPARYFTEKEARRDQGFRDILNMMMMKKQQEKEESRTAWEQKFKERQLESQDKGRESLSEYYKYLASPKPEKIPEWKEKLSLTMEATGLNAADAWKLQQGIMTAEEKIKIFKTKEDYKNKSGSKIDTSGDLEATIKSIASNLSATKRAITGGLGFDINDPDTARKLTKLDEAIAKMALFLMRPPTNPDELLPYINPMNILTGDNSIQSPVPTDETKTDEIGKIGIDGMPIK